MLRLLSLRAKVVVHMHRCRRGCHPADLQDGGAPREIHAGQRYVGGFVGSDAMEDEWIRPQVAAWVKGVKLLARVALRYPQTAYVGMVWSLQAKWQYLSRVSP